MNGGYIAVARKIFETNQWKERRIFSKFEALLWIIERVRYSEKEGTTFFNNKTHVVNQGDLITSIRQLQKEWNWPNTRPVRTFLQQLVFSHTIVKKQSQGSTRITLCELVSYKQERHKVVTPTQENSHTNSNEEYFKKKKILKKEKREALENTEPTVISELVYDEEASFEKFWNLFDKKIKESRCRLIWADIGYQDRQKIFKVLPAYVKSKPEKKYRMHPANWLKGECWNDEIIIDKEKQEAKPKAVVRPMNPPRKPIKEKTPEELQAQREHAKKIRARMLKSAKNDWFAKKERERKQKLVAL